MSSSILLMLAIFSFGGIIFIISRKIPDIKNIPDEDLRKNPHSFHILLVHSISKIKKILNVWNREFFVNWLEKFLRKMKLFGMKIDRYSHNVLLKIKHNKKELPKDDINYLDKLKNGDGIINNDEFESEIENDLIKIIVKNPKNIEAYKELGKLYFKIKNYSDARQVFLEILKIDAEDEEAKKYLNYLGD